MLDERAIDETSFDLSGHQKLLTCLKMNANEAYIDLRKWPEAFNLPGGYRASAKGIMLKVTDWPKAIKAVEEMMERHSYNTVDGK